MGSRASMRDGLNELFRRSEGHGGGEPPDRSRDDPFASGRGYVTTIKVVGVGGAGTNAVNRMVDEGIRGVEFIAVNTDTQALEMCDADVKVHIGQEITHGLGGGADPDVGREAMEASRDQVKQALRGSDMVFITAGEGGGTGTGASPVIAAVARELDALTVAIVTRPFAFEGRKRSQQASEGIEELRRVADAVIIIPNERLLQVVERTTTMVEAFRFADDVLRQGVQGITDLITVPGLINLDFADVRTIMKDTGTALMGIGSASGDNRASEAATQAIASPLLETSISGARGILMNITGGKDLSLYEVNDAAQTIADAAHDEANIIFGAVVDERLEGRMTVTVIATGFDGQSSALEPSRREENEPREPREPVFEPPPRFDDEIDVPSFVRRPEE
jgi:cell division protein FtsZ